MAKFSYQYDIPTPLNIENLDIEVSASSILGFNSPPIIAGSVIILAFDNALSDPDIAILDDIVANHDGSQPRTTAALQKKREDVLSKLVNMAHVHPVLKLDPDMITDYLTSIDNWFNAWKRDGNHNPLVAKITADAQIGEPYYDFLNTQVSSTGALTYQFLISGIPTTPYI